jgi:hypothetical protein
MLSDGDYYSVKFENCSYLSNINVGENAEYIECTHVDPNTCTGYSDEKFIALESAIIQLYDSIGGLEE